MGLFKKYVSQTRKPEGFKRAGFSKVKSTHHKNKPWITVIAKK